MSHLPGHPEVEANPEEIAAFERVTACREDSPLEVYYDHLNGCIMVVFHDIRIGIEENGYAHS